jgi:hypothetical protein
VGGVFDHAEMENGANLTGDSNHTLGWQVGAGFAVPIGNLMLTPGARYRVLVGARNVRPCGNIGPGLLRHRTGTAVRLLIEGDDSVASFHAVPRAPVRGTERASFVMVNGEVVKGGPAPTVDLPNGPDGPTMH